MACQISQSEWRKEKKWAYQQGSLATRKTRSLSISVLTNVSRSRSDFSSCHPVLLSSSHPVLLSSCQLVIQKLGPSLSGPWQMWVASDHIFHPVIRCHFVFLLSYHPVILSSCHLIILSSCHPVIFSSCHLVIQKTRFSSIRVQTNVSRSRSDFSSAVNLLSQSSFPPETIRPSKFLPSKSKKLTISSPGKIFLASNGDKVTDIWASGTHIITSQSCSQAKCHSQTKQKYFLLGPLLILLPSNDIWWHCVIYDESRSL